MMSDDPPPGLMKCIPLFPLPNVVLFPHTVLPLHVFEQRYRDLTRDALLGHRQIAMALLRPGWERDYYGHAEIDPVVCVGEILTHEKLPDGKYNFLLRGHTRARIVREVGKKLYRQADLQPLLQTPAPEIDLQEHRRQLLDMFRHSGIAQTTIGGQIVELFTQNVATPILADVIAFHYLEDITIKQELLAEADVRMRLARLVVEMDVFFRKQEALHPQPPFDPSVN